MQYGVERILTKEGYYYLFFVLCSFLLYNLLRRSVGSKPNFFLAWKLCSYVSPLTVIGAASLLLFFSKFKINNSFVNLCGKGCFSVYLLHGLWGYWFDILKYINITYSGIIYILSLLSFLIIVYFGCIFVDLLRIRVWTVIEKIIKSSKKQN